MVSKVTVPADVLAKLSVLPFGDVVSMRAGWDYTNLGNTVDNAPTLPSFTSK